MAQFEVEPFDDAPPPLQPEVAAYLKQKQDALAAAQSTASGNRLIAGLARAGGTLANGYGSGNSGDKAAYDALDQDANAPVQNVLNQQKSEDQALSQGEKIAADDPNSQQSKAVQTTIARLYPGKFTPDQLSKVAASQAQDVLFKPLELDEKIQSAQNLKAQALADRSQKAKQATDDRAAKTQEAAMSHTIDQLESARGNPAVQQAEKDIYASSKVNSLANLYGDPNNLNPQMVKMLVAEVGKIASGGQASEAELNYITPNTLSGKLAGVWQQLSNSPSPANAAAFIKQYQDYANSLTKDAQAVIKDKYGRIIDSRANMLGSENVDTLNKKYINRFDSASNQSGSGPKTPPGSVVMVKGQKYRVGADGDSLEPL